MKTVPIQTSTSPILTALLVFEAVVLTVTTVAFWHHSPPIRDNYVWLLWLALPIFAMRLAIYVPRWYADWTKHRANQGSIGGWLKHRLRTINPLLPLFAAFILLTLYNYQAAPYHRASYIVLVCRPLLGIWLVIHGIEQGRVFRTMTGLLAASITAGLIVGGLSLTAVQWTEKSAPLMFLINTLPKVDYKAALPDMLLSFNPNEIAGALTWLCPLVAGLMLYPGKSVASRLLRLSAGIAFILTFAGLFFGQSRFAIGGVLVALAGLAWLCIPQRWLKYTALAGIGIVALIQAGLTLNVLPLTVAAPDSGLSGRDQSSLENRGDIWASAFKMMQDYLLTGAGMSMFRTAVNTPPYIVPYYAGRDGPPHAHNEWLQAGADLGIPGLLLFLGWQAVTLWMLWQAWRNGDTMNSRLAVAIAGGLFAHAVYGTGDAVTLWDRYSFLLWWLMGLAAALYTVVRLEHENA